MNDDKYIRERAIRLISAVRSKEPLNEYDENDLVGILIRFAENKQPVLCKDCQHGGIEQEGFIPCENGIGYWDSIIHTPDWFCAGGVRRDDGQE